MDFPHMIRVKQNFDHTVLDGRRIDCQGYGLGVEQTGTGGASHGRTPVGADAVG